MPRILCKWQSNNNNCVLWIVKPTHTHTAKNCVQKAIIIGKIHATVKRHARLNLYESGSLVLFSWLFSEYLTWIKILKKFYYFITNSIVVFVSLRSAKFCHHHSKSDKSISRVVRGWNIRIGRQQQREKKRLL